MKISERQIMLLLKIVEATLNIYNLPPFTQQFRQSLIKDIYEQQDSELKESKEFK